MAAARQRQPEELIFNQQVSDVLSGEFMPPPLNARKLSLANLAVATYLEGGALKSLDYGIDLTTEYQYSLDWAPGVRSSLRVVNDGPLQKFVSLALSGEDSYSGLKITDTPAYYGNPRKLLASVSHIRNSVSEIFVLSDDLSVIAARTRVRDLVQRFFIETERPPAKLPKPSL
jgi:hypothetical protein